MDELRRRRDEALAKLDQLQGASENAWEDIKAGTELAWEAIAQSIRSARTRFRIIVCCAVAILLRRMSGKSCTFPGIVIRLQSHVL